MTKDEVLTVCQAMCPLPGPKVKDRRGLPSALGTHPRCPYRLPKLHQHHHHHRRLPNYTKRPMHALMNATSCTLSEDARASMDNSLNYYEHLRPQKTQTTSSVAPPIADQQLNDARKFAPRVSSRTASCAQRNCAPRRRPLPASSHRPRRTSRTRRASARHRQVPLRSPPLCDCRSRRECSPPEWRQLVSELQG